MRTLCEGCSYERSKFILDRKDTVKEQNITNEEFEGIDKLKKDETIMILPADKGRVKVVMNKKEYEEKCQQLLEDSKTYQKLKGDPTQKFKKELVSVLKDLKERGVTPPALHKKLYPTVD